MLCPTQETWTNIGSREMFQVIITDELELLRTLATSDVLLLWIEDMPSLVLSTEMAKRPLERLTRL